MSDITYETLPAPQRGPARRQPGTIGRWLAEIAKSGNTTEFAKFPEPRNPVYSSKIQSGAYSGFGPGDFEVTTRRTDYSGERAPEGKVWLYAKWNGNRR